ncbi:unnamed protein product [Withania somnifera]
MGRNIPLEEVRPIYHPLVYFSFVVACISATVAIFSSLCASSNTRDNINKENSSGTKSPKETSPSIYDASFKRNSTEQSQQGEESIFLQQRLPPPPSMGAISSSNSHLKANSMVPTTHSSSSNGRLSASVSMRAFGGSLGSRQTSRREDSEYDNKKRDKKLNKDEDSIWKKQIILGEKCKIPADEYDDTILYDENGNRISAYHPKPLTVFTMSRQSSNVEEDEIPK